MTIELTVDELEKVRLCSNCVGEAFLSTEIERQGKETTCSYCVELGATYSIGQVADAVAIAFRDHYDLTESEPDLIEYHMTADEEIDYVWQREGDPVTEVIAEAAEVSEEVAEDVRKALEERELEWFGYHENPFDSEAQFVDKAADDAEYRASWLRFEESLTTEGRFFNSFAEEILQDTFGDLEQFRSDNSVPIIITAGPQTDMVAFYRARVFQAYAKLENALKRPDLEVGPPPSRIASHGRMNPHGVSVFYGATDPNVAMAEVRPPVGSRVVVGRFEILRPVRLLNIKSLSSIAVRGSIFDRSFIERLRKASFLSWLSDRIAQPVMPEDEPFEYLPTQAIAEFLAARSAVELDGIIYPSVQSKEGANVVLFHKSSRIQELNLPEGTDISVYSHDYTEEGEKSFYSVSEEVPSVTEHSDGLSDSEPDINDPILLGPIHSDHEVSFDHREITLQLDVKTLEVRYVKGVEFDTDKHEVLRHRSEKRLDLSTREQNDLSTFRF